MKVSENQLVITSDAAHKAVGAAVRKAESLGVRINVAIADSGGNPAAFLRMPGAFLPSIDIARDKALTAVGFGIATDDLYELIKHSPALRDGIIARSHCVAFAGGLPIFDGDVVIGGIGVSGGSEEQDSACAKAGIDALNAAAFAANSD